MATPITADQMKQQKADVNAFQQAFQQRQAENNAAITGTMGNTLNTQKQGLQDAFLRNTAAQNDTAAAGRRAFAEANADLGVQTNRTQTGMDDFADVRGLNRTAGSQQALALGQGAARAQRAMAERQQAMESENQMRQQLLTANYNNDVQKALANHDYREAAALLDEYKNGQARLQKQAELLAGFGNFAGNELLYGPDTARAMSQYWAAQNPEQAYNTGLITAAEYERMTGKKTPDYVAPVSSGGWGWYGGGYGGNGQQKPKAKLPAEVGGQSTRARMTGATQ